MEERGQYAFLDNKYRTGIGSAHDTGEELLMSRWYGADHLLRLLGTYKLHPNVTSY